MSHLLPSPLVILSLVQSINRDLAHVGIVSVSVRMFIFVLMITTEQFQYLVDLKIKER